MLRDPTERDQGNQQMKDIDAVADLSQVDDWSVRSCRSGQGVDRDGAASATTRHPSGRAASQCSPITVVADFNSGV
jgi:hypothetical protein